MKLFFVCLMVLNATFNNISVISWWSVLLVEETGVPGGNHRFAARYAYAMKDTYILLLMCFTRMNFEEQSRIESEA